MTIDLSRLQSRLEEAIAARAEARRLASRRQSMDPELQRARTEADRLRNELADHQEGVDKLSGPSVSRLLASLSGGLTDRLTQQQAEVDRIRYDLDVAENRLARFSTEADQLEGDLARLGPTEVRYEEALGDLVLAARATGSAMVDEVVEDAERRLAQLQRRSEVEEALAAGAISRQHLQAAQKRFSAAGDWSMFDMVAGGGIFASLMKHDRLDKATDDLRAAAASVERFSHELGDVHLPGVSVPLIDTFERGIDVWFDNIFTDLSIHGQIRDARAQLDAAAAAVDDSLTRLRALQVELAHA